MIQLSLQGLSKSFVTKFNLFGRPKAVIAAVRNVSFQVERGQTVALVGESGSGKSTTARLVLRLLPADSGHVEFDGVDVRNLNTRDLQVFRRKMQIIFQDPYSSFDPRLSIGESIAEPMLIHFDISHAERWRRATELLERVSMSSDYLHRLPSELSGGQLQRAAIARALTLNPQLIICDEAVAALDVSIRAQVLNLLRDLQKEFGLSYLFITHDLGLVRAFADHVYLLSAGEIVESGAVDTVFSNPQMPYTQQLFAAIPALKPHRRMNSPGRPDRVSHV